MYENSKYLDLFIFTFQKNKKKWKKIFRKENEWNS